MPKGLRCLNVHYVRRRGCAHAHTRQKLYSKRPPSTTTTAKRAHCPNKSALYLTFQFKNTQISSAGKQSIISSLTERGWMKIFPACMYVYGNIFRVVLFFDILQYISHLGIICGRRIHHVSLFVGCFTTTQKNMTLLGAKEIGRMPTTNGKSYWQTPPRDRSLHALSMRTATARAIISRRSAN